MKLAIISHTEHYTAKDGTLVGWSPTVNEINHLLEVFDTIYHLAMHYEGPAPKSVMAYSSDQIHFIPLPAIGGPKLWDKLKVLWHAPKVIRTVSQVLKQVDYFQLRTPTGIGVFLIPYLSLFSKCKGWYKYAGNWNQVHPPLGYRFQRWCLKHQSRNVTLNGHWPNQPQHCLSFENPCLTEADLEEGLESAKQKAIEGSLTLCFVGRMELEKGAGRLLEALQLLSKEEQQRLEMVHFVGEGPKLEEFKAWAKSIPISIQFHGSMSRDAIFEIYRASHAIILPTTASEGFPKVLAEAMAFGCIPVASNVSAIGHYIQHGKHGFLLETVTVEELLIQLRYLFTLKAESYRKMLPLQHQVVQRFTFEYYNDRIRTQLLMP